MKRRALLLSVALAGIFGCADAWAGQTKRTVGGEIGAMAFAGDAVIVARELADGSMRLERLAPGAPAQTLLRVPRAGSGDPSVGLAATAQAVAFSVRLGEEGGPSHVYVGPPAGPMREVAACQTGLLLPAVAVSGSRVAWASGGCGEPADTPVAATPATIVTAGADASVPPALLPLGAEALPTAFLLTGQTGLAGLLRPSFFLFFKSEVRQFGATGLGEAIAREDGGVLVPIGALPNGDTVFSLSKEQDEGDGEDSESCDQSLFVLTSQGTQRRPLSLGGCPTESDVTLPGGAARLSGDRVYAIVREDSGKGSGTGPPPPEFEALRSIRIDGGAGRLLARGAYRAPRGLTTDAGGRVGWWYEACIGGSEIVIDDLVGPAARTAIAGCNLKVLSRTARVRGRRTTVRLRCPSGCSGQVFNGSHVLRAFALKPGTHRLRLRLTQRERRSKRLRLRFEVNAGATRLKVIRLR